MVTARISMLLFLFLSCCIPSLGKKAYGRASAFQMIDAIIGNVISSIVIILAFKVHGDT
jgi:hypothetical protein